MNPWQKKLNKFCDFFPMWAPRVVKWRPSGLFSIKIWLNDGNFFLFSKKGKCYRLIALDNDEKKGKLIYESASDCREGL